LSRAVERSAYRERRIGRGAVSPRRTSGIVLPLTGGVGTI
jgi:hypothetical protein